MNESTLNGTKYYFGQRVIVSDEIAIIIRPPMGARASGEEVWVRLSDGVVRWFAPHNVKPLPNGEL